MPVLVKKKSGLVTPPAKKIIGGNAKPAIPKGLVNTGKAAQAQLAEADARAQAARDAAGRAFRFFIGNKHLGEDFLVTFLDGDLDEEGNLNQTTWAEHRIQMGGTKKPTPFACLEPMGEICPLCMSGDRPATVAVFSLLDHTVFVSESAKNKGKEFKDQKRLYVAGYKTIPKLQKFAEKNDGLRGWQMEISRSTENDPAVGDIFTPVQRFSYEELQEEFGRMDPADNSSPWKADPLNYDNECPYVPAEELAKLGMGGVGEVVGAKAKTSSAAKHL